MCCAAQKEYGARHSNGRGGAVYFSHHCDLDAISVSVCDEIQVDPRQGLHHQHIISASASDAERK